MAVRGLWYKTLMVKVNNIYSCVYMPTSMYTHTNICTKHTPFKTDT